MIKRKDPILNEFITEIQYSPNSKILDYRGKLASEIANAMKVSEWGINENRLDVFDNEKKQLGFVSYKNCGFLIRNDVSVDYFEDKSKKFLKYLFAQKEFGNSFFVTRIGVRFRYGIPVDCTFDELVSRIFERILEINPKAKEALNSTIVDNNVTLSLKTPRGVINFMAGPMEIDQIKNSFQFVEEPSAKAFLYLDFDYWIKPNIIRDDNWIISFIRDSSRENNQRYENIVNLLLGD